MVHVRQQIRDAVETAVTSLTTTGSNVFANRFYRLEESALPCLAIYTNEESVAYITKPFPRRQERLLEVVIDCCAQATADADNTIDTIIKEVEEALDSSTLSGLCKTLMLARIEAFQDGSGTKPIAGARLFYVANYSTLENDVENAA